MPGAAKIVQDNQGGIFTDICSGYPPAFGRDIVWTSDLYSFNRNSIENFRVVLDGEILVAEEHVGEEIFGYPVVEEEKQKDCREGDRNSPNFPDFPFKILLH